MTFLKYTGIGGKDTIDLIVAICRSKRLNSIGCYLLKSCFKFWFDVNDFDVNE